MLKFKPFKVTNDGLVMLVDVMGDDSSVLQAARISYGNDVCTFKDVPQEVIQKFCTNNDLNSPEGFESQILQEHQAKLAVDDRYLIRYLMRNRHTTPFEMCELKFLVRCPMDCWRQWIRHRTANVNEYSTRYTHAIDSRQVAETWRKQAISNKQGSMEGELNWAEGLQDLCGNIARPLGDDGSGYSSVEHYLSVQEEKFHEIAQKVYEDRLACGVAKEQARKDLPLSTYTEAYWKIDLHNLLHFLNLRMDSHAQSEIRQYATVIGEQIVKELFPVTWEAFVDYRLEALALSKQDILGIQMLNANPLLSIEQVSESYFPNRRERQEFCDKVYRLNVRRG